MWCIDVVVVVFFVIFLCRVVLCGCCVVANSVDGRSQLLG